MKTIILMRHSIAKRLDIPNNELPLSEDGKKLALKVKEDIKVYNINKCYCSSSLRAYETASILFDKVEILHDLHERIIGDAKEDFWYKQYTNYDYKNVGGESLNEVKDRMQETITGILNHCNENDCILVVSHGTAICSYLLNFCTIEVIDALTRSRKIVFKNKEIMQGNIDPTNYFVIKYKDNKVEEIKYVDTI